MAVGSESLVVKMEETGGNIGAKSLVSSAVGGGGAGVSAGLSSVFSVVGVGLAAVASVVINQVTYRRKMSEMLDMYKDEVAAQLGKSPTKVTTKDMELVGKGDASRGISANKTIADGVSKLKRRRNVGMLVTTGSILATVGILITTGVGALPVFGTATLAATAGTFIFHAAMGVMIHSLMERPMHWAAKKIFQVDDNANDLIADLKRQHRDGKAISREQVVGVFVSANKELDGFVKNQFGKDYDDLTVQEKQAVTNSFEQYLPVTALTENLNAGRIKISELAFAVEGQNSGVAPGSVKDDIGLIGKMRHAIQRVHPKQVDELEAKIIADAAIAKASASSKEYSYAPPKRKVVEYDNPVPERSFASRIDAERSRGPAMPVPPR